MKDKDPQNQKKGTRLVKDSGAVHDQSLFRRASPHAVALPCNEPKRRSLLTRPEHENHVSTEGRRDRPTLKYYRKEQTRKANDLLGGKVEVLGND